MQMAGTRQQQGFDCVAPVQVQGSCRVSVYEIKERAGANPPGLVTSTDAEIGPDGRQKPRGFVNRSG